jgi:peroxiredoxin
MYFDNIKDNYITSFDKVIKNKLVIFILLLFTISTAWSSGIREVTLTIHLRGVYESKISLMTTVGGNQLIQTILTEEAVKNGETATLSVPVEYLPGEFVLRFDYKEKVTSTPYPSEKNFVINQQDLELWVHPIYCNNVDSTWFQEDETENATMDRFMKENYAQKEQLGLLQNFLMNYDDIESDFYQEGIAEYEKRRKVHNKWISDQLKENRDLFISSLFNFQYVPEIIWKGSESDRRQSFCNHYFDNIDFNDSLLIRTRDLKSWMDQYVNLFGEEATTNALRDSLFTLAGKTAIEKAKTGHPAVYGWMVDYFYKGYESFNIEPGIAMLAPYLDDPNCLTSKKQAILKRLEGMKTLLPGTIAPDFSFEDDAGNAVNFHNYQVTTPYKLVLFWSADCPHCMELVNKLYSWWLQPGNKKQMSVLAVSLDETETEVAEYKSTIKLLPGWQHILTAGGVNSPEANSYFILATPVMVLVNSQTNEIVSMPETVEKLAEMLK